MTGKTGDTTSGRTSRDGEAGRPLGGSTGRGAVWAGGPRGVMYAGASTPEELEMLLEDALVLHDGEALATLFEESAVLVADKEQTARGGEAIARLVLATGAGGRAYVADPRRVLQARDLALIVAAGGINVARRDRGGAWRYGIVLLAADDGTGRSEP